MNAIYTASNPLRTWDMRMYVLQDIRRRFQPCGLSICTTFCTNTAANTPFHFTQEASSGNVTASRLAQEAATTTLLGPWRQGAPMGRAGSARGAHLQLTLPPGRTQVRENPKP